MSEDVLFEELSGRGGSIGLITLNRPAQLNAVTQAMCVAIHSQLAQWQRADAIKAVVICGMGEKAFSAGGDIRSIYEARSTPEKARQFFLHEYSLNSYIHHFSKPYIAIMQGITMGGGAGLTVPGKYRIATETLRFAMPETGIGFFTDVGASYFLTRCPHKLGWYLGLTGASINAADAHYAGLVDVIINEQQLPELLHALIDINWLTDPHQTIQQILCSFAKPTTSSTLQEYQSTIDACFSQTSIEKIFAALEKQADAWSQQIYQVLQQRSPLSLKIVLEQLNRGVLMSFDDCMRMEYRIANRFLVTPDFYEGVRAAVIDKDRSPRWHLDSLDKISFEEVSRYFAPLIETTELEFITP